jgi:hypothetical protein
MYLVRNKLPQIEEEGDEAEVVYAGGRQFEPATIYLSLDGNQTGPYAPAMIRQMMGEGSIAVGTYYWKNGMGEWRPVEEFGF